MAPTQTRNRRNSNREESSKKIERKWQRKNSRPVINSVYIRDGENYGNRHPMYFPSTSTAFKLIFFVRVISACFMYITDCDETFNYWEPAHYLIYGKGFQTWEYAPQYALRSYAYLVLFSWQAKILSLLPYTYTRFGMFYVIRIELALISALCETIFFKSIGRCFGISVARLTLVFLLFSPGMFISATAFLPSSFSMYMIMAGYSCWFKNNYKQAIMNIGVSTLIGWPFTAVLGFPIAIEMIFLLKKWTEFLLWTFVSAITILAPQTLIDSIFYGRFVIAAWNIVKYNIFTSHGPDLYGTEIWHFYIRNLILNFNIVFVLAIMLPLVIFCVYKFIPERVIDTNEFLYYLLSISPFFVWFAIFTIQPHKEERFMYPVYPLLCLCGAISLDGILMIFNRILCSSRRSHYVSNTKIISSLIVTVVIVFGVARIVTLYKGYRAPMKVYSQLLNLGSPDREINVCIGKEWHRFPSSFMMPDYWEANFIESEFRGQLPGKYARGRNATMIERSDFNDLNLEVKSRYMNIDKCDFIIDLDTGRETKLEPNFSTHPNWTVIYSVGYLDPVKTDYWARIFAFPYIKYMNYNILKRKNATFELVLPDYLQ